MVPILNQLLRKKGREQRRTMYVAEVGLVSSIRRGRGCEEAYDMDVQLTRHPRAAQQTVLRHKRYVLIDWETTPSLQRKDGQGGGGLPIRDLPSHTHRSPGPFGKRGQMQAGPQLRTAIPFSGGQFVRG